MLDKFLYNFFAKLDDAIAFVETYVIKMTEWCWQSRVKLLNKRFSPYCSVATWYLWRSIDPEPIQY